MLTSGIFGRDAIAVYPPPVETEMFSFAEDIILSYGRYSSEKNYEFILEVAEKLRDEPIRFVIVGASSRKISGDITEGWRRLDGKRTGWH
ncbi:hypothetical protein DRO64_05775 [Candidatus Bathyarchaeota archaeon]|nr:MAG: hypothetical protein DRO64_05775 [Candidatus Bathyarchaeota archaeon]